MKIIKESVSTITESNFSNLQASNNANAKLYVGYNSRRTSIRVSMSCKDLQLNNLTIALINLDKLNNVLISYTDFKNYILDMVSDYVYNNLNDSVRFDDSFNKSMKNLYFDMVMKAVRKQLKSDWETESENKKVVMQSLISELKHLLDARYGSMYHGDSTLLKMFTREGVIDYSGSNILSVSDENLTYDYIYNHTSYDIDPSLVQSIDLPVFEGTGKKVGVGVIIRRSGEYYIDVAGSYTISKGHGGSTGYGRITSIKNTNEIYKAVDDAIKGVENNYRFWSEHDTPVIRF